MFLEYRVIQKEISIFMEVTVSIIVTKPFNMCLFIFSYREEGI